MSRLLIISNRLPVNVVRTPAGLRYEKSVGGLATGLASCCKGQDCLWLGWPGLDRDTLSQQDKKRIAVRLGRSGCVPVHLSAQQVKEYYEGFSNKTLWPLFHYFQLYTVYEHKYWQTYQQVNRQFAQAVIETAQPGDTIWIHDYQLLLLPGLLRSELKDVSIGFFLHIPFPSFEVFRLLPWRKEIIDGMLGADLVGFHTYDYVRHFLSSITRLAGREHSMGRITIKDRAVKVDAFPMGIDYQRYAGAANSDKVQKEGKELLEQARGRKIIMSVDRLDYTKGILQRLEAYDLFLQEHPGFHKQVVLILLTVPSRTGVEHYEQLRNSVEQLVGRINGRYGSIGWVPVWYMYRSLSFEKLVALYSVSDVALITPLRDGMNLIAKEYVAACTNGLGVLILSEMAGAASELPEALVVNSNNRESVVEAIVEALQMPEAEQIRRNRLMQKRLGRYTVQLWSRDFLESLRVHKDRQLSMRGAVLSDSVRAELLGKYAAAKRRLLLLDYDGTLAGFAAHPEDARPDAELLSILRRLCKNKANSVVIISGRDRQTLSEWLGGLDLSIIAEHGAWRRCGSKVWKSAVSGGQGWKKTIRPVMDVFSDRTPGSEVEEKDFSLVWHFRRCDPELAQLRMQELKDALRKLTTNLELGVFEGSKILEIKHIGINKGRAAADCMQKGRWGFVLAAGDDYTDEDLFAAMPKGVFTIKIGYGPTRARFTVDSVEQFRSLLLELAETAYVKT